MMMRNKLSVFIFTILASTSFCRPVFSDEKELRQWHHNAEFAMQRKDYAAAKEAYLLLWKKIDVYATNKKYRVDWETYVDIGYRLAKVLYFLGDYEEGLSTIKNLLTRSPPKEYFSQIKALESRMLCATQQKGEAYVLLKNLARIHPLELWKAEDRTFFLGLEYLLDEHYDQLMHKAKRFLTAKSYPEAITMYEQLLEGIEKHYYPKSEQNELLEKKIRYLLAQANFLDANFEKALFLMTPNPSKSPEDELDRRTLYLTALAYREKREYDKALEYFIHYTHSSDKSDLKYYDHALFEIAMSFYSQGNLEKAKKYFETLTLFEEKKKKTVILGKLYLARIYLKENAPHRVEELLTPLNQELSKDDSKLFEATYLLGEAAFLKGAYSQAIELFENSIAPQVYEWSYGAYYKLGLSYLMLAQGTSKNLKTKKSYFDKSERIFQKLLTTKEKENAALALTKLYLVSSEHLMTEISHTKIQEVLKSYETFSTEGQLQALLYLAETETSFEKKEAYYARATESKYAASFCYPQGWLNRGMNYFKEGYQTTTHSKHYYQQATQAFQKAFELFETKDPQKAALALKWEAKANYYGNEPLFSLDLLEKLLKEFPVTIEEKEEAFYLRGLIASQIDDEKAFKTAESSLETLIHEFPKGDYAADALYVLGTLYFQKGIYQKSKECFLKLASDYSSSKYAGEGWYWAAESSEKANEAREIAIEYRKKTYEKYPRSLHADDAYLRCFSMQAYLEGQAEALSHLHGFALLFPTSKLLVQTYHILAKHAPSPLQAKEYLLKSLSAFETYGKDSPDFSGIYFYYSTRLAIARQLIETSESSLDIEEGVSRLYAICQEFQTKAHPLARWLQHNQPYPSIYEESEFLLAIGYLKQGKQYKAQKILCQMLSHYAEAGISEGYFLSRVWEEQGKLAFECEDFDTSLKCLDMAEECGLSYLSSEEFLSLWILKSHCYRENHDLDKAMLLLSQVINEESPSPLRLKAMFLRAEIYELQGRHELAIKQLEATAKKGGEWALFAKDKLKDNYGLQ